MDFPLEEVPFPVNGQEIIVKSEPIFEPEPQPIEQIKIEEQKPKINFFDSLPIRLPEISSEDLEHFEDAKLDSAYEERLLREGDNLKAIKNASQIISSLLNITVANQTISTNGAATAPAKAKPKIDFKIPDFETETESTETLILSENPTEDELWRYAENNPTVKRALRIFRGKIISVTKE